MPIRKIRAIRPAVRVLVTGGAGFIGSHIVEALLLTGHEVAVLDNLSSGRRENVPAAARFYQVDLRDREATSRVFSDFGPQRVCHQAAQASVAISVREPHLDADINLIGGLNLLDACTARGSQVERVVFASTGGAIYGEVPEGHRAGENTAPSPISPYAIHKLAFEYHLEVYRTHRQLPATTLRYANVYGPRQDPHGEAGVVAIFFDRVLARQALRVNARRVAGDAGCVRDYVFVSDVARANLLALDGGLKETVLNVGTGTETSTQELAQQIIRVVGQEVPLEFGPLRPGDIERSLLDPTRTQAALGALVSLADGLRKTYEFYAQRQR